MTTKKSSVNARLDFARMNNISVASRLRPPTPTSPTLDTNITPADLEASITPPNCICNREPQTLVCIYCKMFTFGRISKTCPMHKNVSYLMDFMCCPYCCGPAEYLQVVEMNYEGF